MSREALFAAVRPFAPDGQFDTAHVALIDAVADVFGLPPAGQVADAPFTGAVTLRMACEVIGHEAIVQEAYKDSKGIWTWGIGVTSASGHSVERYRDNPQPIERCIEIGITPGTSPKLRTNIGGISAALVASLARVKVNIMLPKATKKKSRIGGESIRPAS